MSSKVQEGMDFFHDGAVFIGGTIYITQQDRLGEWSCLKLVMNILVTPESKRAEVATEAREVREVSSTWRLREHGEVFRRT